MEAPLFFWTGKIIWYAVCLVAVIGSVAAAVMAPIAVYQKCVKHLWKWKIAAEIAKYGFTEEEVRFAMRVPEYLPCTSDQFFNHARRIKERGEVAKKCVDRLNEG